MKSILNFQTDFCVIVPTYNNEKTLAKLIDGIIKLNIDSIGLIVINDGSTDSTQEILNNYPAEITVIVNDGNKGKGYSLLKGFRKAIEMGYSRAITIDSDGQHFPSDLPQMLEASNQNPDSVIMGSRNMKQNDVPGKSSFGNNFSNFWFRVETFIKLPDTQTGFRVYPLKPISEMKFYTRGFEFEIETIVRLAWRGVTFKPVPIQVLYDEKERVSHFRPYTDFTRISILNTVLVIICLVYIYPKKLFSKRSINRIREEFIKKDETNFNKSLSLAFGCFMGVFPIWGFQLLVGIPLAIYFKLNKVLFITAANISIPPLIPPILYISFILGQYLIQGELLPNQIWDTSFDSIELNLFQYIIGAIALSIASFVIVFISSFFLLTWLRKEE